MGIGETSVTSLYVISEPGKSREVANKLSAFSLQLSALWLTAGATADRYFPVVTDEAYSASAMKAASATNTTTGTSHGGDFFFSLTALIRWVCLFFLAFLGAASVELVARPFFLLRVRDMVRA